MSAFDETRRKLVHVAMVGFAFLLRPLAWWQGALLALAALAYNMFALRRLHGESLVREHERERGHRTGLVYYPLSVLVLILVYRHELVVAGAAWAVLAFGDGFATLVGKGVGGPRLPWNHHKSWSGSLAFVLFGSLGAWALGLWLAGRTSTGEVASTGLLLAAAILAALTAALVESLALGVDDNLTVPAVAGAAFWIALHADRGVLAAPDFHRRALVGLGVSLATGLAALAARGVDRRGLLVGVGIGTAVWAGAGAPGYLTLFAFFVLGTLATRIGYREKAARGMAEARGGRRSSGSALAKGLVGALAALAAAFVPALAGSFAVALVAAFATAAADTVSSEIGKAYGRRAVLAATFRRVEPGTEGAISVEGTVAGWIAAAIVAALGASLGLVPAIAAVAVVIAAAVANHLESVAGHLLGAEGELENELLNFLVTLVGAVIAVVIRGAVR